MIQNWSTIETIAEKVVYLRNYLALNKHLMSLDAKREYEQTARKWEKLLAKFADSCKMVEEYAVLCYAPSWIQRTLIRVNAICPDAAVRLALSKFPVNEYSNMQGQVLA